MGIDGQPKIWPVILSGGSGTRLWPKSRTLFPKQFHVLTSEHSLLQEALLRVKDDSMYANPMVICNEEHRFIVAEQAEELNIELQDIVLEPEGRNTAPAVAVATALVRSMDPTGLVLVLAADHHIPKVDQFTAAVALGRVAASKYICTFGVTPTRPLPLGPSSHRTRSPQGATVRLSHMSTRRRWFGSRKSSSVPRRVFSRRVPSASLGT